MRCATDTDVRIEYERVSQHHYGHFEDDQKTLANDRFHRNDGTQTHKAENRANANFGYVLTRPHIENILVSHFMDVIKKPAIKTGFSLTFILESLR